MYEISLQKTFMRPLDRANKFASIERRAKKRCGRPLRTKDGREGPGREEAMTRRPDLAISAMRCFPLVAVFSLILRPS